MRFRKKLKIGAVSPQFGARSVGAGVSASSDLLTSSSGDTQHEPKGRKPDWETLIAEHDASQYLRFLPSAIISGYWSTAIKKRWADLPMLYAQL